MDSFAVHIGRRYRQNQASFCVFKGQRDRFLRRPPEQSAVLEDRRVDAREDRPFRCAGEPGADNRIGAVAFYFRIASKRHLIRTKDDRIIG